MESKSEISNYLENIAILLLGVFVFAFPLVFTTITTDPFTLPKQILLIAVGLILMLLSGARMISEGKVKIRKTPFDLPLIIFAIVLVISSILAINKVDAIMSTIPALFAIILYFFIINLSKNKPATNFILTAFLAGSGATALITVLSFLKLYIFPIPFTKNPSFTPLGGTLDNGLYFLMTLPIIGYFAYHLFLHIQSTYLGKGEKKTQPILLSDHPAGLAFTGIATILSIGAIIINVYQMMMVHPILLPFDTGFRTAFASISQDTGRTVQSFLFGSGYGTYAVDFTRFKEQAFNLNPTLWSLTFFRSSSYVLELLATTGVAGLISFGLILYTIYKSVAVAAVTKKMANPLLISLALASITSILLPLSPIMIVVFFIVLGLYAAIQRLEVSGKSTQYYDIELHFVAFTEGLMPIQITSEHDRKMDKKDFTKILPVSLFIIFAIVFAVVGFFTYNFTASDILFQRSLVAASQNNGLATYTDQVTAIRTFPYRDAYYRIASQTDLALANSLASSIPAGSSPSAQIQQNVTQLIQESITTGRAATQLAPATAVNWQNLSSIYRGLIGFGQNAEQFSIATQQQAIALSPNDPQGYINLGGIYYQLAAWENAQQSFQQAASLKPDYPNAYYNLGHALENKGDAQNALLAYQQVQQLVAGDKQATEKITGEIESLKQKVANAANQQAQAAQQAQEQQAAGAPSQTLETNKPATQLPQQKKEVKIPEPKVSITPAPTTAATPSTAPVSPTPEQ